MLDISFIFSTISVCFLSVELSTPRMCIVSGKVYLVLRVCSVAPAKRTDDRDLQVRESVFAARRECSFISANYYFFLLCANGRCSLQGTSALHLLLGLVVIWSVPGKGDLLYAND